MQITLPTGAFSERFFQFNCENSELTKCREIEIKAVTIAIHNKRRQQELNQSQPVESAGKNVLYLGESDTQAIYFLPFNFSSF